MAQENCDQCGQLVTRMDNGKLAPHQEPTGRKQCPGSNT